MLRVFSFLVLLTALMFACSEKKDPATEQEPTIDEDTIATTDDIPDEDTLLPDVDTAACNALAARIDNAVAEVFDPDISLGLIVGYAIPDCAPYFKAYGYAESSREEAATIEHRSRLASITKTFTAVLILQLVGEGALSLDDTIDAWYPDLPNAGKITIRMLLDHTSGLYTYVDIPAVTQTALAEPEKVFTAQELLDAVAQETPYFEPGEGWHYTNTGYLLLGEIAQIVSGKTYIALFDERIRGPLQLEHTFFPYQEEPPTGPVMHNYSEMPGVGRIDFNEYACVDSLMNFSGGMWSRADDLLVWIDALLKGDVLSSEQRALMLTFIETGHDGIEWGLGLARYEEGSGKYIVGHDGDFGGLSTELWLDETSGASVVVLASSEVQDYSGTIRKLLINELRK